MEKNTRPNYRPDIHGLRAWAVIAVLFFHFGLPGSSAGFIGVDVFFVISGFLMTSIIIGGLEDNNFSIFYFYLARIRRIVPALIVVLVFLLILGWFFLPTPDYQSLGSQSAYSLSFLSNIHYWRSAGYFDAAAHDKWLLHTWSLGIEFQFYILFPIFMLALWKIKPKLKTLYWGLILVFLFSLALSMLASSWKPAAAFYLLPTRGWELAAGGLAFLISREIPSLKSFSKPIFWVGFSLWVVAAFIVDSSLPWPSGWAMLPVMGTALIIIAQHTNAKIMVNPITQWLGDRSYSLYLWHWPLVVALYFAGLNTDWVWTFFAFGLSLLLGDLSYRFIENPIRNYLSVRNFTKQIGVLAVTGMVVGFSAVGVRLFAFEERLPKSVNIAASEANNKNSFQDDCYLISSKTNKPVKCNFNENPIGAYLVGDSHADSMFTSIGYAANNYDKGVVYWAKGACPTLKGARFNDFQGEKGCYEFNNLTFEYLNNEENNFPLVIINRVARAIVNGNEEIEELQGHARIYFDEIINDGFSPKLRSQFKKSLIETSCTLSNKRPVYLVRPIPEMGVDVPKTLSRNIILGRDDVEIKISLYKYHERQDFIWKAQDEAAEQCGVKILNPLPYLCDDEFCYGSRDGRPLYYDDDHLSEYGNKFLVPMFEQVFLDQNSALTSEKKRDYLSF